MSLKKNVRATERLLFGLRTANEGAVSYFARRQNADLNAIYRTRPLWFYMFEPCFEYVNFPYEGGKCINLFYHLQEEHNIDVNAVDVFGNTALHLLTRAGENDFARVLVESGADVNIPNDQDETPFSLAIFTGNYHLATYFFDKGGAKVPSTLLSQFSDLVDQQSIEMRPWEAFSFLHHYVGMDVEAPKDASGGSYAAHIRQVIKSFKLKGVKNERFK